MRGGYPLRGATLVCARQTRCHQGHEFTPANTRLNRQGSRVCRACEALRRSDPHYRAYQREYQREYMRRYRKGVV